MDWHIPRATSRASRTTRPRYLPSVSDLIRQTVPRLKRDGGLMSYGPDLKESVERTADLVARIFKGARPADLPFEQPTRYLFVVNLKIAKASGIELPTHLVALADEVID
jgi:ABC-type uncharacterized transport system substrate-binding protein